MGEHQDASGGRGGDADRPSESEIEQRRQARTGRRVERARNQPIPDQAPAEGVKENA